MMIQDITAADYVLYADTKKSVSGLNKRMIFIMLPLVLLSFLFVGAAGHGLTMPRHGTPGQPISPLRFALGSGMFAFFSWFPWFLLAECVLLYVIMARAHKKQTKPIIVLSPEGITVDTTATHIGLIRWEEIEEVRSYTLIYRYVGIVPKNTDALCRRLGGSRSWLLQVNAFCIPLYKLIGVFVAPINIPQVYLPITVDELTARIHTYQEAYTVPPGFAPQAAPIVADGSIWPPPPAR